MGERGRKKKAALLAVWLAGRAEKRAHPHYEGSLQYFVLEQTLYDNCTVLATEQGTRE